MSETTTWDCVVVGAGCAGAIAAREMARRGRAVLLVERDLFPRYKVCGGCLSESAIRILDQIGITQLQSRLAAIPLKSLRWKHGSRDGVIDLPAGIAISREKLDAELVRQAIEAGAVFQAKTSATYAGDNESSALLNLKCGNGNQSVSTRLILDATGLGGSFLRDVPRIKTTVSSNSRMGFGVIIPNAGAICDAGEICMYSNSHGYVGMVQVEDCALNIAAAIDGQFVKQHGSVQNAMSAIINNTSVTMHFENAKWKGTPLLTRSSAPLGSHRLLLLGDSAGYVEPFTGEGMGWAIASAVAVGDLADQAVDDWDDSIVAQWTDRYHQLLGGHQRVCRMISAGLRRGTIASSAIQLVRYFPTIAGRFAAMVHSPIGGLCQ